jgi:hypothetical protein
MKVAYKALALSLIAHIPITTVSLGTTSAIL